MKILEGYFNMKLLVANDTFAFRLYYFLVKESII